MKYMRTESGIYEVFSSNSRSSKFLYPTKKGLKLCQRENWRCRFADSIEELCDAFIIIDEDKKKSVYLKEDSWTFDMMQDLGMWSDRTCYGAIWIYAGSGAPTLKSVAKMNDKGELELL